MDALTETRPRLGILRLIGDSFRLFLANAGFMFPLALAPTLAAAVLQFILAPSTIGRGATAPGLAGWLVVVALTLVGFVVGGMLCLVALDLRLGKRHSIGAYLGQAMRHAGPLALLGVLYGLAIGFGAVFLILPGLYLSARYLVYVPAIVFENAGWAGLGRARTLTEGHRWPLVGGVTLLGAICIALAAPAFFISVASGQPEIVEILVGVVVQSAIVCVTSTFTALVYIRLREIGDGLSTAEIAATID